MSGKKCCMDSEKLNLSIQISILLLLTIQFMQYLFNLYEIFAALTVYTCHSLYTHFVMQMQTDLLVKVLSCRLVYPDDNTDKWVLEINQRKEIFLPNFCVSTVHFEHSFFFKYTRNPIYTYLIKLCSRFSVQRRS